MANWKTDESILLFFLGSRIANISNTNLYISFDIKVQLKIIHTLTRSRLKIIFTELKFFFFIKNVMIQAFIKWLTKILQTGDHFLNFIYIFFKHV